MSDKVGEADEKITECNFYSYDKRKQDVETIKEEVNECFDQVDKLQAEILLEFQELRNFTQSDQEELKHVAFENNFEDISKKLKTNREEVLAIVEFEEKFWEEEQNSIEQNRFATTNKLKTKIQDFEVNLVRYLECSLLEEHGANFDQKDDVAKEKYFRQRFS